LGAAEALQRHAYPTPRRLNTHTLRFIDEEANIMTQTDLHASSRVGTHARSMARFAGSTYNDEKWNDQLAKELNITKYGFNEYLNKGKFDSVISTAHPDLEWKKLMRIAFEDGKNAEE
jgi:hypothetical protein